MLSSSDCLLKLDALYEGLQAIGLDGNVSRKAHDEHATVDLGNGRTVELVPGGLAYFPTRIPHAIYAEEPSVMMLTMVTPARDNIGD